MPPRLIITASPHLKPADSTPRIMWTVVGSLVPVIAAAAEISFWPVVVQPIKAEVESALSGLAQFQLLPTLEPVVLPRLVSVSPRSKQ